MIKTKPKYSLTKIFILMGWIVIAVSFVWTSIAAIRYQDTIRAKEVKCKFVNHNGNYFLNEHDIKNELQTASPEYKNKRIKDIKINQIEQSLKNNDYIQNAEIVTNQNGNLCIYIEPKNPIARIQLGQQNYYITPDLKLMPTSPQHSKRVIFVSGHFQGVFNPTNHSDSVRRQAFGHALKTIQSSTFWNAATDQLIFNADGSIELVLTFSHAIHKLGVVDSTFVMRLNKIENFYKTVAHRIDLKQYRQIDFRYDQQVVAIKND